MRQEERIRKAAEVLGRKGGLARSREGAERAGRSRWAGVGEEERRALMRKVWMGRVGRWWMWRWWGVVGVVARMETARETVPWGML